MDARAAASMIKDGDTVALSGVVSLVVADAVLRAIGERFLTEGSPRDLTIICPCRAGWRARIRTRGRTASGRAPGTAPPAAAATTRTGCGQSRSRCARHRRVRNR